VTRWLTAGALALALLAPAPPAAAADDIEMTVTIDGQDVSDAGLGDPIDLDPEEAVEVRVELTNGSDDALVVRDVEIEGVVIGITFLSYVTDVNLDVEPGATDEVTYELPLRGLGDQAVGLLPANVTAHSEEGAALASQDFTVDVAGSATSLFGLFGLFLALITAGTVGLNMWLVARRRLPPNRLARALRFALSGIGLGLTLTVALAATRIAPPYATAWVPLLLIPTVGTFLLGYFSPGPLAHAWPEDEIDVALRETEGAG
jgi:hypothetical protein